jgi:acyl-CoA synthetase (AMP-forming)/AMP-acid ligase II
VTDVRSSHSLSYGELAREAERVAAFLTAQAWSPASGRAARSQRPGLSARRLRSPGHRACLIPLATNLTPAEMTRILAEAFVRFTSGTTATSKGVLLAHEGHGRLRNDTLRPVLFPVDC